MLRERFLLMNEADPDAGSSGGGGAPDNTPPPSDPPADPATPSFRQAISENNGFRDTLPQEYREDPTFKDYKSLDGLLKSHKEQAKMIGERMVLPKDDAGDDVWENYFTKHGRPSEHSEYEVSFGDDIPRTEEQIENVKKMMHKAGLNKKQASILMGEYVQGIKAEMEANTAKLQQIDKEFEDMSKSYFGDDAEFAKRSAKIQTLIENNVDKEFRANLGELDSKSLMTLMVTLDKALGLAEKKEEQPLPNEGTGNTGSSHQQLLEEHAKVYAELKEAIRQGDAVKRKALENQKREISIRLAAFDNQ